MKYVPTYKIAINMIIIWEDGFIVLLFTIAYHFICANGKHSIGLAINENDRFNRQNRI